MSKANFACTMTYKEKEDKTKFPPETNIIISGIDKESLRKKIKTATVVTIPVEDNRKTEKARDGEEK